MELRTCENCGCVIEDGDPSYEFDWLDGVYCDDCVSELLDRGEIAYCEECEEYFDPSDAITVNRGRWHDDLIICPECAEDNDNFAQCRDCYEWFDTRYMEMYDVSDDERVCYDCYSRNDYVTCTCCGAVAHDYEMTWDEDEDEYYCSDCEWRMKKKVIKNYSYKPDPKFKSSPHDEFLGALNCKSPLMFGVELEVDRGDDAQEGASAVLDCSEDVYCKHDGSLGDEGFEIVTHPATLEYHRNELGWDKITQACIERGFRSHETFTCGLHVHVGRVQLGEDSEARYKTICNLLVLLSVHRNNVVKFTRRSEDRLDQWASMPDFSPYSTEQDFMDKAQDSGQSRYQALNLNNWNTIEFRIFRGTLKVNTLFASLEFCSNMVKYAKSHTFEECRHSDWLDVMRYEQFPELDQYLEERELNVNSAPWAQCPVVKSEPATTFEIKTDEDGLAYVDLPDRITESWVSGFNRYVGSGGAPVLVSADRPTTIRRGHVIYNSFMGKYGIALDTVRRKYDDVIPVMYLNYRDGHDCGGLCPYPYGWNTIVSEIDFTKILLPF